MTLDTPDTNTAPDRSNSTPPELDDRETVRRRPITHVRHVIERWVVPIWITLRVLAVDISAIVTNDSVGYIGRGLDPFSQGLVGQGYRQVGYAVWLWTSDRVAGFFDWDRLFGVALLQRAILLAAILLAWWILRWWSAPFVLLATAPTFVVHADLVLNEGLLMSGCVLMVAGAVVAFRRPGITDRHPILYLSVLSLLAFLMATLKLQYAALLLFGAAAAAVICVREVLSWRRAAVPLASALVAILAMSAGQAFENRSETGVFEPVSEQARADWYGAYQVVFTLHPENKSKPELSEFYAEGNLYTFLHGLEQEEGDYQVRRPIIEDRVEALFEAANTSARSEQVQAFFGAFSGGRMDDIAGIINGSLDPNGRHRATYNGVLNRDLQLVTDRANNGIEPGELSIGPLSDVVPAPIGDHRGFMRWIGPLSAIFLLASFVGRGSHRLLAAAALTMMVGVAGVLGSAYIDNARYLLGPISGLLLAALAVASMTIPELASRLRQRLTTGSTSNESEILK